MEKLRYQQTELIAEFRTASRKQKKELLKVIYNLQVKMNKIRPVDQQVVIL